MVIQFGSVPGERAWVGPAPSAEIIRGLHELAPLVRRHAAEMDRRCALPEEIVRALFDLRAFRLWIPRRYQGLELPLPDALAVYEAAAFIDGSLGWAVMIGAGGGLFAAYLEDGAAREIFGPDRAVIAGSGAPDGKAERVEGGYRVSGRWRYASGAPYATTFTANCIVTHGSELVLDGEGRPLVRAMAFELSDVTILETWNATGMRGTASHDFEVRDAFVPERRSFSVLTDSPREPGPLYRLPFGVLTELPVTAVALGIAHHALEAFADFAAKKKIHGSNTPLAQDPAVQTAFGRAHATWRLAKAGVAALAAQAWEAAVAGQPLQPLMLAEITAGCARSVSSLREAVDALAAVAGMTAIQQDTDFARAWRDLLTLAAHVSVSPIHLAAAGATLLGARQADNP